MPLPNAFAIAGLVIWFGFELVFRRREQSTATWQGGASDRNSTLVLVAAFGVALVLTVILLNLDVGRTGVEVRWIGVATQIAGLLLRAWAMRVLGRYYTRTVRTLDQQVLVTDGPYAWIRHPGYAGSLLVWTGFCLGVGDWIALLVVAGLLLAAYAWRAQTEERTMLGTFGPTYRDYQRRTARLIPGVY